MIIKRTCKKCEMEKELEYFSKSKNCKDGRRYTCKLCWNKKYIPKGKCTHNPGWFKNGHKLHRGCEKKWIVKGQRLSSETEFKRGQKPHNFIDGLSKERYIKTSTRRYAKIRDEIKERDGNMCLSCGVTDRPLQVHHKVPRRVNVGLVCEKNNLVTLCQKCHAEADRQYRKEEITSGV